MCFAIFLHCAYAVLWTSLKSYFKIEPFTSIKLTKALTFMTHVCKGVRNWCLRFISTSYSTSIYSYPFNLYIYFWRECESALGVWEVNWRYISNPLRQFYILNTLSAGYHLKRIRYLSVEMFITWLFIMEKYRDCITIQYRKIKYDTFVQWNIYAFMIELRNICWSLTILVFLFSLLLKMASVILILSPCSLL